MLKRLRNLFRDEEGQDLIEYALLAAFIAIAAIAVLLVLGPMIVAVYQKVVVALGLVP